MNISRRTLIKLMRDAGMAILAGAAIALADFLGAVDLSDAGYMAMIAPVVGNLLYRIGRSINGQEPPPKA